MLKILFLLFSICYNQNALFASEDEAESIFFPNYKQFKKKSTDDINLITFIKKEYIIRDKDELITVIKHFIRNGIEVNKNSPSFIKTVYMDSKLKDLKKIKSGEKITLFIEEEFARKGILANKVYNLSLNFMASLGSFNQTDTSTGSTIKFQQTSPITVGSSYKYDFKETEYSLNTSFYYSIFNHGQITSTKLLSFPAELGLTFHGQYKLPKTAYTFYSGLDWEKYNIYNLDTLNTQAGNVKLTRVTDLYFTTHA